MTSTDVPPTGPPEVGAAGGVLIDGGRVLAVHRPAYDDWSLPKGKVEPGETWQHAAIREIHEETGVVARLGVELPATRHQDDRGRIKHVRWWRMEVLDRDDRDPDDEVDELRWLSPQQAADLLSYDADRHLVTDALAADDHVTVLLVRHAHAGDRQHFDGDDRERPLSTRGHRQAALLAKLLAPWHIVRLISSPMTRCVQTLTPLATHRGAGDVDTDPRLAEGAPASDVEAMIAAVAGPTVLCSHGDVIGDVIAGLRRHGLVTGTPSSAKASTWVLTLDERRRPVAADHLAAPT